jgi:DNA replicative helicase MCM subunit Mcm2 (Cdc46/Mcm family)
MKNKTQTVSPNKHKDSSVLPNQENDTQTVEGRKRLVVEDRYGDRVDRPYIDGYLVGSEEIIAFFDALIQQELKANDEKWKSKVLELKAILEKNKEIPISHQISIDQVNDDYEGNLITIEGELIERRGTSWSRNIHKIFSHNVCWIKL